MISDTHGLLRPEVAGDVGAPEVLQAVIAGGRLSARIVELGV